MAPLHAVVLGLFLAATARAEPPSIRIEATVDDDLRGIRGRMTLPEDLVYALVDPLARLPEPPNDLHLLRTYPGRPSTGAVEWIVVAPGVVEFTTQLPRRYDDLGWTPRGLLANGGWYPQPTSPASPLPVASWQIEVELPPGRTGALGDDADQGRLTWTGVADRVPLAVVRRARLTQLGGEHWSLDLVTRGRPRRILVRELEAGLDAVTGPELPLDGTVVQGPLRRRLARPGPGLLYLSDRAFRLTPPLQAFHRVAVARGLAAAWSGSPDPLVRDVVGAAIGQRARQDLEGVDADRLLGAFRWVPQIHWLLANERMPFYADVLERTHPSDPIRDDLAEVFAPAAPGTAIVVQADDRFGPGSGVALGLALARGLSIPEAEVAAGIAPGWLDTWRVALPDQDYRLEVDRTARTVTVTRVAPEGVPDETVRVRIDGEDRTRTGGPGSTTWTLDEAPGKVRLDPERSVLQSSRLRDAWPERYMITLSAGITSINVTRGQIFGAASMTLRRAFDQHNLYRGVLYNGQSDLVGAQVSWLHQRGPRQGGWLRLHRWTQWAGATLLDPRFADTDGLKTAWELGTAYAIDNRVHGDFPLRGGRVGASVDGGVVPGLGESWLHTGPSAVGVVPLHPRHALAAFTKASIARANVAHRKLALGGHSNMRSLPALPACPAVDDDGEPIPCQALADQRAMLAVEYRMAPLRNVSVPLALAWGSELQLSGGLEALVARIDGEPAWALGATAGITGVADILGAEPYLGGVTIGWPLMWSDALQGVDQEGFPEIYLRWSQEF